MIPEGRTITEGCNTGGRGAPYRLPSSGSPQAHCGIRNTGMGVHMGGRNDTGGGWRGESNTGRGGGSAGLTRTTGSPNPKNTEIGVNTRGGERYRGGGGIEYGGLTLIRTGGGKHTFSSPIQRLPPRIPKQGVNTGGGGGTIGWGSNTGGW